MGDKQEGEDKPISKILSEFLLNIGKLFISIGVIVCLIKGDFPGLILALVLLGIFKLNN